MKWALDEVGPGCTGLDEVGLDEVDLDEVGPHHYKLFSVKFFKGFQEATKQTKTNPVIDHRKLFRSKFPENMAADKKRKENHGTEESDVLLLFSRRSKSLSFNK
jgi:hypothetical protein